MALTTLLTTLVVTVKFALLDPEAMVTLLGTVAEALLLCKVTTAPPLGATPFSVTVPVAELPPVTVCGATLTAVSVAGFTVSAVVAVVEKVAEITAVLTEETPCVVTVKFALVAPAATRTEDGTVATEVLLLERLTEIPEGPAAPVSVTVPVEVAPPMTDAGDKTTDCTLGGSTWSVV